MYELHVYETNDGFSVTVQGNRITFETYEQATDFIIKLLKATGRIGY